MSLERHFEVYDEQGNPHYLDDILKEGWHLLIFLRHADCIECQLITHELNAIYEALTEWSITVTLVANCNWERLSEIRNALQIQPRISLLTEPSLRVHKAAQLNNSLVGGFGPRALFNILKGTQQGFQQKIALGENMGQQSGLFLIDSSGEEVWQHRSRFLGDIPSYADILEEVMRFRVQEGHQ